MLVKTSYSIRAGEVKYCDERVCLSVCLSASISPELHVQQPFTVCACYIVLKAVGRFFSGGVAICYAFPVLYGVM